ncbi:Por secretion system C-terminal sorting domain-containing protein [Catalinimonas alkaloidigena]|uniref:Por secretion system C-terminal sorting domain-containing protein n=1 Tax=Catalinimonas alkaloidigena TaxID=1075417 RepID=A0A1G9IME3_9BACT|nr:T9SS type A sorting domain-containing protein [Catalinimonas alkaloidigena]SDL26459.1 Por secretion system C-terminal sorting domain-containing protein [Catalinimonas alkaloidigena]
MTIEVNADSTGGGGATDLWLEAECATVGSAWLTRTDGKASNGKYVTITNTYGYAPSENPADQVQFAFSVSEAGDYHFYGLLRSLGRHANSFWVRLDGGDWYNWGWGPNETYQWHGVMDDSTFALSAGVHQLDFSFREPNARFDKLYITRDDTPPADQGMPATNCGGDETDTWLEAECATVGRSWLTRTDANASNDQYVTITNTYGYTPSENPADQVQFSFTTSEAGDYHFYGLLRSLGMHANSFWVRLDGGDWYNWGWMPDPNYQWHGVMDDSTFTLSAGTHQLDFSFREPNVRFDKLYITQGTSAPIGYGLPATNCEAPARVASASPGASPQVTGFTVYPNPSRDVFQVSFEEETPATGVLKVLSMTGVTVHEHQVTSGRWEVDLSTQPAGIYILVTQQTKGTTYQRIQKL